MSKRRRNYKREGDPLLTPETRGEIFIVLLFTLAGLAILAYFNLAGRAGIFIDSALRGFMGSLRLLLPATLIAIGTILARSQSRGGPLLGVVMAVISITSLLHLVQYPGESGIAAVAEHGAGGGYLGLFFAYPLYQIFGPWASLIILIALILVSISLIFSTPLSVLMFSARTLLNAIGRLGLFLISPFRKSKIHGHYAEEDQAPAEPEFEEKEIRHPDDEEIKEIEEVNEKEENEEKIRPPSSVIRPPKKHTPRIEIPLNLFEKDGAKPVAGNIRARQEVIQKTLNNFGIEVEMGDVSVGPTVTQYTFRPAVGVKLASITTLSNDLALALAAHPIRIEAPIPGKSLVGVEVPNAQVSVVRLREVLESPEWQSNKSPLTLAIGRDVSGKSYFADLARMPHLLVAGSTGSGKSVCLNTMILSLLCQNGPDDLKFILIDPKRVEFPIYNGMPHLITPVITNVKETIQALRWAIMEMERRFEILASSNARDIASYNSNAPADQKMPYLVIIVDELADLMVAAASAVEGSIIRLAQMARAVGIHLILATQRPSVEIITGLIKANFTSRIAFSVASLVDSRTILDISGAEKLLGRGDMLFINSQLSKPKRLQGILVSEKEVANVTSFLKSQDKPEYIEIQAPLNGSTQNLPIPGLDQDDQDSDPLLTEAKEVILQAGKASASLLQRRLKVGYSRAARILDLLEEEEFIGPGEGAKPREILAPKEEDMVQ